MPDDAACEIQLKNGDVDRGMFCHPKLNVCVKGCKGETDCPAGWVCDDRETSAADTGGKGAFCTNPTCGTQE